MSTKNTKDLKRDEREHLLDAALDFIQHAPEDEFNQLLKESGDDIAELDKRGTAAFEGALERFEAHKKTAALKSAAAPEAKATPDLVSALTIAQLGEISTKLRIPRQVLSGFRSRRVTMGSVPKRFLRDFAAAAGAETGAFVRALSQPSTSVAARSHKSDVTPDEFKPVTFEQLLIDANVPEDRRAELLRDDE
jgi:hypothetical protein